MKKIVILSGAGISAESGLKTFRDAGGLWEGMDVMQVASIDGWRANPALVLDFYNQRRRQLRQVQPNKAHYDIASLEKDHHVTVITQNVDDLHERAGSSSVLHLHGELLKVRGTGKKSTAIPWHGDLQLGDTDENGYQLRPHIVWFGEEVPLLAQAAEIVHIADIIMVIGSSMQVYPAASLVGYRSANATVIYIDMNPTINAELSRIRNLKIYKGAASVLSTQAINDLKTNSLL